jgi:hypothetical protein
MASSQSANEAVRSNQAYIERRSSSEFERLSGMQSDEVVGVVLAFDDLPDSGEAHRFAGG